MKPRYNEVKGLVDRLTQQGWRVERRKKCWMAFPPDPSKPAVPIHLTPSDYRGWRNMMAHLSRSGLVGTNA